MISSVVALMAAAIAMAGDVSTSGEALTQASSAPAEAPAPAKPVKVKKVKDPGDTLVCHDDAVTGSHLGGVPICKKQKEWDAITNASQHMLQDTIRMQGGYKPPSG